MRRWRWPWPQTWAQVFGTLVLMLLGFLAAVFLADWLAGFL